MSFELWSRIDEGNFGEVFLGRKTGGIDNGEVYAVKLITTDGSRNEHLVSYNELKMFQSVIGSPFCAQLKYAFRSPSCYVFIMEYFERGNLYDFLKGRTLTFAEAKIACAELVLAIAHLHERRIIHRDIKLENILIASDGHVALTDFGLSKKVTNNGRITDLVGTATYYAPEMIVGGDSYSLEVDWWALGITLYEMLIGRSPFLRSTDKRISTPHLCNRILNDEPNLEKLRALDGFKPISKRFIEEMLIKDPKFRLGSGKNGIANIKSHEYFEPLNWTAVKLKKYNCIQCYEAPKLMTFNRDTVRPIEQCEPNDNESKRFYYVEAELGTAVEKYIKGPTDANVRNFPAQNQVPNACFETLLGKNMFLRTKTVEMTSRAIKQMFKMTNTVQLPNNGPDSLLIPQKKIYWRARASKPHSTPYRTRSRTARRSNSLFL